ncbi:MAG: hypothetical protein VR69_14810 [Peptococcaceae bacterium BRH_c4b]|nr:MAG: hypothetical protein VR69_14810 [Peptococcaceae bacterium BRH_c4b]
MKEKSNIISLVNPNLVTQIGDSLGSGIPYMPLPLAYLAACLINKYNLNVIDAFGEDPFKVWQKENFIAQGITISEVVKRINPSSRCIIIYYSSVMASIIIDEMMNSLKAEYPQIPIIIIENSQAVIGCSLKHIIDKLFACGADYVVFGECEERVPNIIDIIIKSDLNKLDLIDGIAYKAQNGMLKILPQKKNIANLDRLPFPAWEYFALDKYWKLRYAHGPMEGEYLAIMTSRGCPYSCNFCVIPSTNQKKWRARSYKNVVDELEYMVNKFNVKEFHWEDVNPTVNEERIIEICKLIIDRELKIKWKLASGSKIETMRLETLEWMKKAGCNYISFSPESGSKHVLKLMNKPFDHDYALDMVRHMNRIGIKSQACFVLGYPGEEENDLKQTEIYIKKLTKAGVDEIALFIMTPIPGTETFGQISGYKNFSELTFSPAWRDDFEILSTFRMRLYKKFLLWKIIYHPFKVFRQMINLLRRRFESKAEMNIYRALRLKYMVARGTNKC